MAVLIEEGVCDRRPLHEFGHLIRFRPFPPYRGERLLYADTGALETDTANSRCLRSDTDSGSNSVPRFSFG